ncbi:hypothetical protein FHR92_004442 [Fontibacillus solani]|uniref:Uncharacterized protein n=1 Tax=Fontibacillus solani TaxID=1572857 RepID=A0A7W3XTU9_9BACL|nr:hypothetical protein [Fontibacillus solani]MBA9087949.1 hypothetical protein [Fontibacillus solani]
MANYRFQAEQSPYVSGLKSKYKRNVEAIRLLKQLESAQRQATTDEQHVLAGYVGWGGLANTFHPTASGWETEYAELKQLLDENKYDGFFVRIFNIQQNGASSSQFLLSGQPLCFS